MVKTAFSSTISTKGQVTIPLEIRRRLGLKEGDRIEFVIDNGHTVIRPSRLLENPFDQFVGVLPAFGSKQPINKWVAGLREDDQDK